MNKNKRSKKIDFDEKNLKEFMEKWKTGHTTNEISNYFKKENLDISKSKKKDSNFNHYFLISDFFFSYIPMKSIGLSIRGGNHPL